MRFRDFLLIAFIVIAISLITLSPSFNLALFGDDWLSFWRYRAMLSNGSWNHLTYFLTPYGPEDMSVGILEKIFGYESTYYFIVSYLLRLLAALSFTPVVYYLTKNKLATLAAMLFFAVTTIGFDATNWVFNMPTYLSIAIFNIFLYFLLKSREQNSWKLLALSGGLFYLTYVSQPIRMPHLLTFVAIVELFWVFYLKNKEALKQSLIRIIFFSFIFFMITKTGQSAGMIDSSTWQNNLSWGVDAFTRSFSQGRIDLLFYPIVIVGSLILPDISTPDNINIATKPALFFSLLLPIFAIFMILSFIIIRSIEKKKGDLFRKVFISAIGLNILVGFLIGYRIVLLSTLHTILLLIGGYAITWVFILFFNYYRNPRVALALFLTLSWTASSFILSWFRQADTVIPTTHRYLTTSGVGISFLIATLISIGTTPARRLVLFYLAGALIILHIFSTRFYVDILLDLHSQKITNKIWSQVPTIPELGETADPIIFYFDGKPRGTLHNVLIFGFPAKIALLQKPHIMDYKSITMDIEAELISAVTDGKSLKRFGLPQKPLPVENVYSFNLVTKEVLINTTEETRKALRKIIQESTPSSL